CLQESEQRIWRLVSYGFNCSWRRPPNSARIPLSQHCGESVRVPGQRSEHPNPRRTRHNPELSIVGERGDEVSVARFIADQRTFYRVPYAVCCAILGV